MLPFIRPLTFLCFLLLTTLTASTAEIKPVKYVFLFIGDGMSLAQQQLAEEFRKNTENRGLKINSMPYRAITTTHAAGSDFVTDSAAAGTAIACGVKTNNGVIGLDVNGNKVESIATVAKQNGRKVGIISSVTINHATPAAFYAHNASRSGEYEIGLDLIASGFDYFGGGGIARHNDQNAEAYRGDVYELAKEAGYSVFRTPEEILTLKPGVGKVLASSNSDAMPYAIDGNIEGLRLADFTKQAIELLDNPDGFFIMVEGGQVDWACHANDGATVVWDMIEFDDAVSVAFDFAEKNPGEVLIVVTGDHETGMLSLSHSSTGYRIYPELLARQKASRGTLARTTERLVRADSDAMTFENYKTFITENTGLTYTEEGRWQPGGLNLTQNEVRELENDFNRTKTAILENASGRDRVVVTMLRMLNSKSGLTWGSGGHTAMPVITAVWGSQASQIAGSIRDNTDIAIQLKQAVGRVQKTMDAVIFNTHGGVI